MRSEEYLLQNITAVPYLSSLLHNYWAYNENILIFFGKAYLTVQIEI